MTQKQMTKNPPQHEKENELNTFQNKIDSLKTTLNKDIISQQTLLAKQDSKHPLSASLENENKLLLKQLQLVLQEFEKIYTYNQALEAKLEKDKQTTSITDLYNEVAKSDLGLVKETNSANPLVSIIMTSHNTAQFIEASINSLLLQTYKNIEIIIVDDDSSDNTFEIASRIANTTSKVRVFRLNSNLGTYFAKNTGILKSKGDIIFFQDSDDVCHHERIERCVNILLANKETIAVRCAYSRLAPETQHIIKVNNMDYRLGFITLGMHKKVFQEIGFFNCTTKGSDDEFFHRIAKYYGKEKIKNLLLPLYYNTMRENSLFTDMVEWIDNHNIIQKMSDTRQHYATLFQAMHNETASHDFKNLFQFPRIYDALPVPQEMSKLSNPKIPVYINICSIPSRIAQLQRIIGILKNQCDHFHIYLDGYIEIPDFIKNLGNKATVVHCKDKDNSIRDNGKFILLEELIEKNQDGYYITCDDDIIYPSDYINTMIKKLNEYDDKAVIGLHGILFPSRMTKYFSADRLVYSFYKPLEKDKAVNVLGTGTVSFRVSLFNQFSLSDFTHSGMADIYFSLLCKKNNILQICISRPANWLTEDNRDRDSETLYHQYRDNDEQQTQLIMENGPWGYSSIYPLVKNHPKFTDLIPCLPFYFL
ncbi:glycosyltransferase family 2 protein [Pasteurella multocida subsp. multocida]|uniref:Glycosyltransferase family 2 protein n=3 Tax=Pasteurella multocida TaxID=747 RepID=A0A849CIH6_PASMD|nr:glycosyltransferase family A protein [Pasteurella multocida]AFI46027.1 heparosan synthase B [Pasteurella multocida subsp. multocida str. 3480]AWW54939.1 glycosyltransferase family 2 protein [Pasteurella multocida]EPE71781.1 heparosan synthase B [Pasteurella multocida 671/90]MCL7773617.1 glycosyltransferase family 2 protein [Pasteurella multocida]MCL7831379.1 glycosyltransferase family 2 protein [Pasteurella multocida]